MLTSGKLREVLLHKFENLRWNEMNEHRKTSRLNDASFDFKIDSMLPERGALEQNGTSEIAGARNVLSLGFWAPFYSDTKAALTAQTRIFRRIHANCIHL